MNRMDDLFSRNFDEDFFEELEEILIAADVGIETTLDLVEQLREKKEENLKNLMRFRGFKVFNFGYFRREPVPFCWNINHRHPGVELTVWQDYYHRQTGSPRFTR